MEEVVSDLRYIFPILPPYSQQIKILNLRSVSAFKNSNLTFANGNFCKVQELFITAPVTKTILGDIGRNCPLLQVLTLNGGSEFPDPEDDDLIDLFSQCRRLEKLTLRCVGGGSTRPGGLTANFLNHITVYLPNLKYLSLEGIHFLLHC